MKKLKRLNLNDHVTKLNDKIEKINRLDLESKRPNLNNRIPNILRMLLTVWLQDMFGIFHCTSMYFFRFQNYSI